MNYSTKRNEILNQLKITNRLKIPTIFDLIAKPSEPGFEGDIIYDKTTNNFYGNDGTQWLLLGGQGGGVFIYDDNNDLVLFDPVKVPTSTAAFRTGSNITLRGDNSFAAGLNTIASGPQSTALGNSSLAYSTGSFALSSGQIVKSGDSQFVCVTLHLQTNDTNDHTFFINGVDKLVIYDDTAWNVRYDIVGLDTTSGETYSISKMVAISKLTGDPAVFENGVTYFTGIGNLSCELNILVNNSNEIDLVLTSNTSNLVNWTCVVNISSVSF